MDEGNERVCAPGRMGVGCGRCQDGHYPQGGECVQCEAGYGRNILLMFTGLVVATIVTFHCYCEHDFLMHEKIDELKEQAATFETWALNVAQVLKFLQLERALAAVNIQWPPLVTESARACRTLSTT